MLTAEHLVRRRRVDDSRTVADVEHADRIDEQSRRVGRIGRLVSFDVAIDRDIVTGLVVVLGDLVPAARLRILPEGSHVQLRFEVNNNVTGIAFALIIRSTLPVNAVAVLELIGEVRRGLLTTKGGARRLIHDRPNIPIEHIFGIGHAEHVDQNRLSILQDWLSFLVQFRNFLGRVTINQPAGRKGLFRHILFSC